MKHILLGLGLLFVLAVLMPVETNAQSCRSNRSYNSERARSGNSRYYRDADYRTGGYEMRRNYNNSQRRNQSFYRRHRNLSNIGIATAGGALVGGLIGGNRKGIGVGALVGAGSGALYTYVIRPKRRY